MNNKIEFELSYISTIILENVFGCRHILNKKISFIEKENFNELVMFVKKDELLKEKHGELYKNELKLVKKLEVFSYLAFLFSYMKEQEQKKEYVQFSYIDKINDFRENIKKITPLDEKLIKLLLSGKQILVSLIIYDDSNNCLTKCLLDNKKINELYLKNKSPIKVVKEISDRLNTILNEENKSYTRDFVDIYEYNLKQEECEYIEKNEKMRLSETLKFQYNLFK